MMIENDEEGEGKEDVAEDVDEGDEGDDSEGDGEQPRKRLRKVYISPSGADRTREQRYLEREKRRTAAGREFEGGTVDVENTRIC